MIQSVSQDSLLAPGGVQVPICFGSGARSWRWAHFFLVFARQAHPLMGIWPLKG